MFVCTNQHFLGSAASGNQAHSRFHQADVCFGRCLNLCRVQAHFAPAAESHTLRRGNNRLWRVFDGQVDVLKLLHRHVQLVPFLFLRGHKHQHQIGANGKIHGLVGNDHSVEISFQPLQTLVHHGD